MSLVQKETYKFGPFILDPAERVLSCEGMTVSLTPKAFETLLCLVRSPGRMLTKDELLKQIWPDTFVEEVNLAVNISALRKALGETPQEARYIATIPGHGYRFIAEVQELEWDESEKETPAEHDRIDLSAVASKFTDSNHKFQSAGDTIDGVLPTGILVHLAGKGPALPIRIVIVLLCMAMAVAGYLWFGREHGHASVVRPSSIAVLPFVDLSPDKSHEYFSDGLTEALIDEMAKLPGLKVIARSSAFQFKGTNEDLRSVGRKLGVTHIMEGSVSVQGDHVRIRAALTKADDGFELWSETYDRNVNDIFFVQDEIARAVTDALELKLLATNGAAVSGEPRTNALAYQSYLQARDFFGSDSNKSKLTKALAYADQAIQLDPNYAPAWALRSRVLSGMAAYALIDMEEGYRRARADGEHAIALDPNLATGYLALGWIQMAHDWDWKSAKASLEKAAQLEPGSVEVLRYQAALYTTLGRTNDALELCKEIVAVDPLHARSYSHLGYQFYFVGKYEEATAALQKALELNPQKEEDHLVRGQILLAQGLPKAALTEMEQERGTVWKPFGEALAYHDLGHSQESDVALERLIADNQDDAAYQIAQVYAYRGQASYAFEWLELAYTRHDPGLACIKYDPLLDNLRHDLSYASLLRKMHLPAG